MSLFKTGVYIFTNTTTGKFYIGSAANLKKREREHKQKLVNNKHCNTHLQASYNKYGISSFTFKVLLFCSKDDLLFYEQRAINLLQPDYNMCPIAGSPLGRKHTEETKKKMSLAKQGNTYAIGNKNCLGYRHSSEAKAKISLSKQGLKPRLGSKVSEETKIKISETKRKKKNRKINIKIKRNF